MRHLIYKEQIHEIKNLEAELSAKKEKKTEHLWGNFKKIKGNFNIFVSGLWIERKIC